MFGLCVGCDVGVLVFVFICVCECGRCCGLDMNVSVHLGSVLFCVWGCM